MIRSVLAYAENRLRLQNPRVPLRQGFPGPGRARCGAGRNAQRRTAQSRPSARRVHVGDGAGRHLGDSPRFLGFIPAAPTKASLLFDMLISCASIQGISWLEAAGAIHAENTCCG